MSINLTKMELEGLDRNKLISLYKYNVKLWRCNGTFENKELIIMSNHIWLAEYTKHAKVEYASAVKQEIIDQVERIMKESEDPFEALIHTIGDDNFTYNPTFNTFYILGGEKMINHSGICMDYVKYLYESTKYIKCFDEHLVNIETTIQATNDMVQTLGIKIISIFNDNEEPIDIQFWLGMKWPDFIKEIENMIKEDYIIDSNSFAMQLCTKVLDSVISHIQDTLEITSSFNAKIILDDGDYDFILDKNLNREYLVKQAIDYVVNRREMKPC